MNYKINHIISIQKVFSCQNAQVCTNMQMNHQYAEYELPGLLMAIYVLIVKVAEAQNTPAVEEYLLWQNDSAHQIWHCSPQHFCANMRLSEEFNLRLLTLVLTACCQKKWWHWRNSWVGAHSANSHQMHGIFRVFSYCPGSFKLNLK